MHEIKKLKIKLILALIFVFVPLIRPTNVVEAAGNGMIAAQSESVSDATEDWNTMVERLDDAIGNGKGENVNFTVGNTFEIPTDILEKLAGKNATLALHTSNGVTFSVSGRDVRRTDEPISVNLTFEPVIPEEICQQIPEEYTVRQFAMEERENYPCRLNVHLGLGEENAGRHAILYSYDEAAGTMRQEGIYRINSAGHAMFGLKRGGAYVTAVMGGYTVASGDTLSHIAVKKGVSLRALKAVNPQIQDIDMIRVGQLVNIPSL